MQVFLSWSGPESQALAGVFGAWLQSVLQATKPFFSPEDVDKGSFWLVEIDAKLRDAGAGLLFVTPENKEKPWLLFEAGALVARFGRPTVIPLLFGLEPADLVGPLPSLNVAVFGEAEMLRVVKTLNQRLEADGLSETVLVNTFEMWWPELNKKVDAVLSQHKSDTPEVSPKRTEREMIEEILELVRETHSSRMGTVTREDLGWSDNFRGRSRAEELRAARAVNLALKELVDSNERRAREREAADASDDKEFGHLLPE